MIQPIKEIKSIGKLSKNITTSEVDAEITVDVSSRKPSNNYTIFPHYFFYFLFLKINVIYKSDNLSIVKKILKNFQII